MAMREIDLQGVSQVEMARVEFPEFASQHLCRERDGRIFLPGLVLYVCAERGSKR